LDEHGANQHEASEPGTSEPKSDDLTPTKTAVGAPTNDERVLAAVSHGVTFFEGGLIGPLIIYLVKKDTSDFVAFHALQSLAFGALFFGITFATCGLAAVILVWPYMIFEGIATFKAYEGEYYELPIVGAWARKRHPGAAPGEPVVF
jgi:uncharacterized membrane protein